MCVCVCVYVCVYALDTINTLWLFLLQRTDVSATRVSIKVIALSLPPNTHAHVQVATRALLVKRVSRAYVFSTTKRIQIE